ncbi:DeoR/GlpR family DNA-binding transcription regulator [Horticoccus luteus]|uniref:DeoR/GlpR family DNA-binding transcription regulator n=1 Tax=Horticoccus luteus TaxID=2862869 RepID=A0A8F9XHE0_9BACT|nr:DeoR/GlpR family DNA-binding transcription regulator [Horticoccus luteus]QYM80167.1 DeoR/GlpR family DNA-binding transcription regulator [Horticoccus luteus]
MTHKQRIDLIERFIREHQYADLRTLAEKFAGSLSTVRRALDHLETCGIVRRHHGGASLVEADAVAQEYDFIARNQRHPEEKFAIASLIAAQVQPGMTVILDGGSTTFAVARLLADKRLQVITNSLPVAGFFGEIGSVETIVTGGSIYSRLGVLVGPMCEQSFEQTHADLAILGGAGITESGIWNHNTLIVAAQRKMIAAAERTIFALDNSKFGRKALSLTTPFDPRFTIVTDVRPTPAVVKAIHASGAKLTLTGKRPA